MRLGIEFRLNFFVEPFFVPIKSRYLSFCNDIQHINVGGIEKKHLFA